MDLPIALTPNPQGSITEKQRALYLAIVKHKEAHDGNSPTLREMQDACDISSTSVVTFNLKRLERAQLIQLEGGTRSIRVVGGRWSLDS